VLPQIGSTILAQAAGVPTVAWSGSGVSMDYASCGGEIPKEVGAAVGVILTGSSCVQWTSAARLDLHLVACWLGGRA
jgi:hypothetical protein